MPEQSIQEQIAAKDKELSANAQQLQALIGARPDKATGSLWWRADEAMTISSVVLGFGVLVILLATALLHKTNKSADSILQVFGTILIIFGAIFLVVAGYTQEQIGPVMGLLGTIAGYLLGKASLKPAPPPPATEPSAKPST